MTDKVVSLSKKRDALDKEAKEATEIEVETSFEEIMKANEAKKERMARERNQANKSVLRSYRIKH